MSHSEPLLLTPLADVASHPLADFVAQCHARLAAGERLVTLFGRPATTTQAPGTVVTAVFQPQHGGLALLRGHGQPEEHYPSLAATFASAQIYERELWEQTGLVPDSHPWLKQVRFEGVRQQHMDDYPFFKVRGAEVHEVGVGPIHASVIEPGHFRFMCHGEKIHHLEIQLGYQHRGVEALLLRRPAWQLSPLVESISGDSVVAYAWGHCAALEALSDQPASLPVALSRAVALELERVALHVATLNGMATDIAFLQGAATYGRLRTAIINASQRVCGNRFGRGWIRPGTARPITETLRQDLQQTLAAFARDFAEVNLMMLGARSVKARLVGTGVLTTQAALELGVTGVTGRASGVALDARSQLPGAPYAAHPLPMLTEPGGDCWARMVQRMREVEASVTWLRQRLGDSSLDLATLPPPLSMTAPPLRPNALCISLIEGTRGPVLHALETNAHGTLLHYKVQDPSLANWFGEAVAVRNNGISDFPICNKSFDLSYCGNDL